MRADQGRPGYGTEVYFAQGVHRTFPEMQLRTPTPP